LIISGDTIQPSIGSNITVPNATGINVGNTEVFEIGTTGVITQQPYWKIVDQKVVNNAGGTFTSGSWQTRTLNTTIGSNTITGSSLLSNQFTLPSGTYRIFATAPAFGVNRHKGKLRNITDASDTLIGTNGNAGHDFSTISGVFTITSSKTFEIQHQCQTSSNTNGFGLESNFGVVEIYTQVELWKLGN
jgi:hypothetical protein